MACLSLYLEILAFGSFCTNIAALGPYAMADALETYSFQGTRKT